MGLAAPDAHSAHWPPGERGCLASAFLVLAGWGGGTFSMPWVSVRVSRCVCLRTLEPKAVILVTRGLGLWPLFTPPCLLGFDTFSLVQMARNVAVRLSDPFKDGLCPTL